MKDTLWATLDRSTEWVKYAESKSLAIMGFHGISLGFFMTLVVEQAEAIRNSDLIIAALFSGLIVSLTSIGFCFKCLNPRLKISGGISPIYFGSVATNFASSSEYLEHFRKTMDTDSKIEDEVAGQVYINKVIAWRKFKDVTWALRFLIISIPLWLAVATLLIFK